MKKRLWFIAPLLTAALLLAACGGGGAGGGSESGGQGGGKKQVTVGLALSTLNNPYFVTLRDGAQKAADAAGVKLIVADAGNDLSKQTSQIEDFITQKVDVIVVNPVDSDGIVPAVQKANDAHIPVIAVDRGVNGGKVATTIASDNVEAGKMAAEALFKALGGSGKVAELEGVPGASATRDRGKGFDQAVQANSGIQVVAKQTANFDRSQGLSVMENILQANPDLNGVFAENDEMALGALQAIKNAGKAVKVVGIDGTDDALKAIKAGDMVATVAQQPEWMGKTAVEDAVKLAQGGSIDQAFTAAPLTLIDASNVDQYLK
ncbi:MAG: D-ribose ABC transporter substrate-binding protein [Firmicutes bacterium]|nr:D-ribose ABC transporter substrate-binding protein [Bacillota bacterium]